MGFLWKAVVLEQRYISARWKSNALACAVLIEAADNDDFLAAAYVSILYEKGCKYIPIDREKAAYYANKAMPWIHREATRGNPYAQFHLGFCYDDGRGITQNRKEAVNCYQSAVAQGCAIGHINLGEINMN